MNKELLIKSLMGIRALKKETAIFKGQFSDKDKLLGSIRSKIYGLADRMAVFSDLHREGKVSDDVYNIIRAIRFSLLDIANAEY